jgi:hypothetical protein
MRITPDDHIFPYVMRIDALFAPNVNLGIEAV